MNPASRSPWADWFRFMKSMSIVSHGKSRLNCVWRWAIGLRRDIKPAIHIFDGENVCIHRITPAQLPALLASRQTSRIACGVVTTGLNTTVPGNRRLAFNPLTTCRASSAT